MMLLLTVVVSATAVLVALRWRVRGAKAPLPSAMSDQWMAEQRLARRS